MSRAPGVARSEEVHSETDSGSQPLPHRRHHRAAGTEADRCSLSGDKLFRRYLTSFRAHQRLMQEREHYTSPSSHAQPAASFRASNRAAVPIEGKALLGSPRCRPARASLNLLFRSFKSVRAPSNRRMAKMPKLSISHENNRRNTTVVIIAHQLDINVDTTNNANRPLDRSH